MGRELAGGELGDTRTKYLAFLSSTRYINPGGSRPTSHSETLARTRGHVALGGGGLALFHTGCLWTWPCSLAGVQVVTSRGKHET